MAAVINGRRRWLTIVGVALSPEYVYAIRPGEIVPGRAALRHFLDGPPSAGIGVRHGRRLQRRHAGARAAMRPAPEVIAALDRLIAPYGGRGAIPQALQPSAWTLENEL